MSAAPPGRILGSDYSPAKAVSDNPYSHPTRPPGAPAPPATPASPGSQTEIVSFDEPPPELQLQHSEEHEHEPTETTALLPTPPLTPTRTRTPPSSSSSRPRRPISLTLSFLFSCLLLYVNLSFLVLTTAAISWPFIAHNALPPHFGSMFLPVWLTLLALLTNILSLIAFLVPAESPKLSVYTNLASAFALLTQLILILAVGQLRHRENILTLVLIGIAIISTLHAAASARLVLSYRTLLRPPVVRPRSEVTGFWASLKRVATEILSFLSVSLPIVVLHVAIVLAFVLLTLAVISRAYDASLNPQGQLWKVNPWRKKTGTGVTEINGRPFMLHLACRGIDVDPYPPLTTTASPTNVNTSSLVNMKDPAIVRRTILIETEQGIPGAVGAKWVTSLLKQGVLTSPDTDVRVCFYDRPGYGFSDSSPASTTPHVVAALQDALSRAGEIARIDPNAVLSSIDDSEDDEPQQLPSMIPSPLARSGFILVAQGYGAVTASLFASLNPRLVHSALYLQPIPPALHFRSRGHSIVHALRFFFVDSLGSWATELGVLRLVSVLRGVSRDGRVLSTEHQAIRGEIMRSYLQEEGEKHKPSSKSSIWWERMRTRYPERPTIVLSPVETKGHYGYSEDEWVRGQQDFVEDVVGKGLVEWETTWSGKCGEGGKADICRESLLRLIKLD
ncbi:hypothetical protein T439DRAFT_377353 [Meredithblackwellia eburnea MCA 4105]